MDAQEIIDYIATAPKKTPVKLYIKLAPEAEMDWLDWGDSKVFDAGQTAIVFGDWAELAPVVEEHAEEIEDIEIECDRRNSGVALLDLKGVNARIEPGAIIREKVEIGDNAVIMMGAIINIGAVVAAGAVVIEDVPAGAVVAGCPAKVIKMKDAKTAGKTALVDALRTL